MNDTESNENIENRDSESKTSSGSENWLSPVISKSDSEGSSESSRGDDAQIAARKSQPGPAPSRFLFNPPIDIFGTEEGLVLRADLPGVSVERLELQIEDNKLTLFGRVEHIVPEEARLLHQEYETGDFYRSFILSDEVDYERISAKMNLGVLEIHLPRTPRAQPRKIPVQSD